MEAYDPNMGAATLKNGPGMDAGNGAGPDGVNGFLSATRVAFNGQAAANSNVATLTPNATELNTNIPKPPVLSLPKGGASVHGMGEKFAVNPNTGLGSCSIPITTSAARGVIPSLSLEYSSGAGNSIFGLGWNLSIPLITRKTSKGLPRYQDGADSSGDDVFMLEGHDDLVPVFKRLSTGMIALSAEGEPVVEEQERDGFRVRRYMPRIESAFSRIERYQSAHDPHDTHWVTITGDNQTAIYGRDESSRVVDPLNKHRVFSWLLSEVYDQLGNAMIFEYKAEDSANVDITRACEANRTDLSRSAARHIKRIRYGNRVPNRDMATWRAHSAAELPASAWCFSVVFDYGDHDAEFPTVTESRSWLCRADPYSTCRPGFDVRVYRLCRRVLMFHHFAPELVLEDCLVRSTDVTYDENEVATLLLSAKHTGYVLTSSATAPLSYTQKSMTAVSFEYSGFPSDNELEDRPIQEIEPSSMEGLPLRLDGQNHQWVDLNSEGMLGILIEEGGRWYYKRNTSANNLTAADGTGCQLRAIPRFEPLQLIGRKPSFSPQQGRGSKVRFGDVSGGGNLDVIVSGPGVWGYFEREDDQGWTEFCAFSSLPTADISDPNVRFVDLSGDGLPDILICADHVYTWFPSRGRDGYGAPEAIAQLSDPVMGPACVYADPEETIHFADMTGDGLADLVRVRNSDVCFWPNLGYGRFGNQVAMDNAPVLATNADFNVRRVQLVDLDGNGTADLLLLRADGAVVYQNCSGNGFSGPKNVGTRFALDDFSNVSAIDLLGNGTISLVWSSSLPGDAHASMRYIDIFLGQSPRLLTRISNGIGGESTITYASSNKFYLQDLERGAPWKTKLPFPVQCVERVELIDSISGTRYANVFSYRNGYYDPVEREFRGFGMTETWDSEVFLAAAAAEPPETGATNRDSSWEVPPVRSKTWFHTGVYLENDAISQPMSDEYWKGGSPGLPEALLLNDVHPPTASLSGVSIREACRSLRGLPLRKEVYSDDGTAKAGIPYSIDETSYGIRVVQELQDANEHCVLAVDVRETVSIRNERDIIDARVQHSLVLERDRFGNTLKTLDVAYGRAPSLTSLDAADMAKQETPMLSYVEANFTELLDSETDYLLPRVFEKKHYEITGIVPPPGRKLFALSAFTADNFALLRDLTEIPFETASTSTNLRTKRCVSQSRVLFRRDNLTGFLPKGRIEPLALAGVAYNLCLTPGLIEKAYRREIQGRQEEVLVSPGDAVLLDKSGTGCGYVNLDGDGNLWSATETYKLHPDDSVSPAAELAAGRSSFFAARRYVDPFGKATVVDLDPYQLFPLAVTDAVGNKTTRTMDYRVLNVVEMTDANGNRQAVTYDAFGMPSGVARMGKVGENVGDSLDGFIADVSDSEMDVFYADPSGPAAVRLLASATSRTLYDYRWIPGVDAGTDQRPPYVSTITRTEHASNLAAGQATQVTVTFSYLDSKFDPIQKKALDSPGPLNPYDDSTDLPVASPRWNTSGWAILNNKGQPVREYEPFFSPIHAYTPGQLAGPAATSFYDPLGRRVAALHPNHAFEKTEFTPWSSTLYDAVDNVLADPRSDPILGPFVAKLPTQDYLPTWYGARSSGRLGPEDQAAAQKTAQHANTPAVIHYDVIGRPILAVADNGPDGLHLTRTTYDFDSNTTETKDPEGRILTRAIFDLDGTAIWRATIDKGEDWVLPDTVGNLISVWNSRGIQFQSTYDPLRRPLESIVTDEAGKQFVAQRFLYGDSMSLSSDRAPPETSNLRGRTVLVSDQSGQSWLDAYDFKGNLVKGSRRLAREYKVDIDWHHDDVALEDETFAMAMTYDALDRPVLVESPDGTKEFREYDEAGRLKSLRVNLRNQRPADEEPEAWPASLHGLLYSAKGHVVQLSYGNGITVKQTYDLQTGELRRVISTRDGGGGSPQRQQERIQDLNYTYDPVGNVMSIIDRSQQALYFRNARVDPSNTYTYDALYRLTQATGREHLSMAGTAPTSVEPQVTSGPAAEGDGAAMARYTESYSYDRVGNLLKVQHTGADASAPGWTRKYTYTERSRIPGVSEGSNRLSSTTVGSAAEMYGYEGPAGLRGNMTSMPQLQTIGWGFDDRMRSSARQRVSRDGATPETTYYVYDSSGQRVRKVTETYAAPGETPRRMKETQYLGSTEIFRRYAGFTAPDDGDGNSARANAEPDSSTTHLPPVTLERQTFDLEMGSVRIAVFESRTVGDDDSPALLSRYTLSDATGSSRAEFDAGAQLLSYEEYAPYGHTTYRGGTTVLNLAPKRYRFAGKERDDESGLCYFGARFYAPWLGRWTSCDPAGQADGPSAYTFVRGRPSSRVDPDGRWSVDLETLGVALVAGAATLVVGAVLVAGAVAAVPLAAAALGASPALAAGIGVVATDLAIAYGTVQAAEGVLNAAETVKNLRQDVNPATSKAYTDQQASEAVADVVLDTAGAALMFSGAQSHVKTRIGSMKGGGGRFGGGGASLSYGPELATAGVGGGGGPRVRSGGSAKGLSTSVEPTAIPENVNAMVAAKPTGGGGGGTKGGGGGGGKKAPAGGKSGSKEGSKSGGSSAGGEPPVVEHTLEYGFRQQAQQALVDSVGRDVQVAAYLEDWAALRKLGVTEGVVRNMQEATAKRELWRLRVVIGQAVHQVLKIRIAEDPLLNKSVKWTGDTPNVPAFEAQGIKGKPDLLEGGREAGEVTTLRSKAQHEARPGWEGQVKYFHYKSIYPHAWFPKK